MSFPSNQRYNLRALKDGSGTFFYSSSHVHFQFMVSAAVFDNSTRNHRQVVKGVLFPLTSKQLELR